MRKLREGEIMRHKPNVWMKHTIKHKHEEIGYLQLVTYMLGKTSIPHIEYHVNEGYRNKGIMTRELPKYLKMCKKYDCSRLIAIVENDNEISIKLLERNGFIKIKDFDNHRSYIAHLDFKVEELEKMTNFFYQQRKLRENY